jgi:hypothetical protein
MAKHTAVLTAEIVEKNGKKFCHYSCTGNERCVKASTAGCLVHKDLGADCFSLERPNCPGANYYSIDHWVPVSDIASEFVVRRDYKALIQVNPW